MFNSIQIDLLLGAWTTLKLITRATIYTVLSNLILVSLLLNYLLYIMVVGYGYFDYFLPKQKNRFTKEEEEIYKKNHKNFLKIFEGVEPLNTLGVWIYAIITTKDIILPAVIIYGVESAYL